MNIHQAAARQLEEKRGELQKAEIPEFGEGFAVYYYRYLLGEEVVQLTPFIDFDDPRASDYKIVFEAFAIAARNEEGVRLFNQTNKHQIAQQWDFAVVSRLVDEMGILDQLFYGNAAEAKKD